MIARLLGLSGNGAFASFGTGLPWRAAHPVAATDFPGANAARLRWRSATHLEFAAAAHTSLRPLWFHFAVRDARGPTLTCTLTNAAACLGPPTGWASVRPVYSVDGGPWQRVSSGKYLPRPGAFRFELPVRGAELQIAYCYPYSSADLAAALRPLAARGAVTELCRSAAGHPVPYVRLGNHESPRRSVWIVARQHAGETPASFTTEGLLQRLGAETALLRDTAVHVVPMLDVDGVEEGRFGKDQRPVDFNRDWCERPSLREVRAAVEAIRRSHRQAPVELVLDVHAPHHGDSACFCFAGEEGALDHPAWLRQRDYRDRLLATSPAEIGFAAADWREQPAPAGSLREFLARTLRVPAVTLEVSSHLARTGGYLVPDHYRSFGIAAATALSAR